MYEYEQYKQKCTYSCYNRTKEAYMDIVLYPYEDIEGTLTITEEQAIEGIAKGLKRTRKWRGKTLKETEAATGIPHPTISRYENGENIPSIVQMFKLCTFYKLGIRQILMVGVTDETNVEDMFLRYEEMQ